jgi:hypothetical protein
MTQIFVSRSPADVERRSFEADAAVAFGRIVELNSDVEVVASSTLAKAIGVVNFDAAYAADNSTGTIAAGDMATVALFGRSFKGVAAATFSAGDYLTLSSGKLTGTTTAGDLIALQAATAINQVVDYLAK